MPGDIDQRSLRPRRFTRLTPSTSVPRLRGQLAALWGFHDRNQCDLGIVRLLCMIAPAAAQSIGGSYIADGTIFTLPQP